MQRSRATYLARATLVTTITGLAGCHTEQIDSSGIESQRSAVKVDETSRFLAFRAPAGDRPTTLSTTFDGRSAAILPSGRFVTPAGTEIGVTAPKPFGLALSPDGQTVATANSGASLFSVTLIRDARTTAPLATRVNLDATFMGIVFSADGKLFYASGGENGNLWVGDVAAGAIIGSVNLNGPTHPLDRPLTPDAAPANHFKGTFPGAIALSRDGRYLYVVEQGAFQVVTVDTTQIETGTDTAGNVLEPDNFAAVVGHTPVGRYPFGIAVSPDGRTLLVTNVGVFQYSHLRPATPVGDKNTDYPLCIPGAGYPDEVLAPKTIKIKKIDASTISGLPLTLRDPEGIRCGYIPADVTYTIPTRPRRRLSTCWIWRRRRSRWCARWCTRAAPSARWTRGSAPTPAATQTRSPPGAGASTFRTAATTRSRCSTPTAIGSSARFRWPCCPERTTASRACSRCRWRWPRTCARCTWPRRG
jgi:sugar lactone lactonase YvrE